jgi:hypothetical protein
MTATSSEEIRERYERRGFEREAFDSMPETPELGYFYQSWVWHGPRYQRYLELVKTRMKIKSDYYLADPTTLRLTVVLPKHRFELGVSRRRFWFQRVFFSDDGTPYHMDSLPPERFSEEMDKRREAQRRWLEARKPRAVRPGTTDLTHHKEHGYFEDYGYAWLAYEPNDDSAERVLVLLLRELSEKGVAYEIVMPMDQDNRFGLDVDDARTLDETTDRAVSEILNPQHPRELLITPGKIADTDVKWVR